MLTKTIQFYNLTRFAYCEHGESNWNNMEMNKQILVIREPM